MFHIERTPILDEADVAGAVRYRVEAKLADRRFEAVLVDVGFGDLAVTQPEELIGPDFLAFAGLPQIVVRTLPLPEHVAEKVHAYTRLYGPDHRPSTRVKDLIDLVLISSEIDFLAGRLRLALRHTFESRTTHPLPGALPAPPDDWGAQYRRLARALSIPGDVEEAFREVAHFLDPILASGVGDDARWDPERRAWTT
jgi:hypothetical protein